MEDLEVDGGSAALAALIREHPAVVEATVIASTDGRGSTAWIVADPRTALMLHRSAALEGAGRLGDLSWHEPADGLRVAGLNRGETDFLYREIFIDDAYFRHMSGLPPKATVVDVGANIGMFTLRAALRSPGAHIVAVEPVAELADAVMINAELHGVNATVVCAAAGDQTSQSAFTFYRHNSVMSGRLADSTHDRAVLKGYLLTGEDSEDTAQLDRMVADRMAPELRRVPVTTLTQLASDLRLEHIDLLKIDVEKAEMQVLAGIAETLWSRIDRVVMEVHDIEGRLAIVLDMLRAKGFAVNSDQDPRLLLTPCHTVYARRPEAVPSGAVQTVAMPGTGGPTLRELTQDLSRTATERLPGAKFPQKLVLTNTLSSVPAGAGVSSPERPHSATRRTAVLAEAWAALFGADAVRPDADFFDLGGTSLLALRLLDQVEQELGEGVLSVGTIFETGTFGALAAAMEDARPAETATPSLDR